MKRVWSAAIAILMLSTILYGCAGTAAQENRQSLCMVMGVTGDEFNAQAIEDAQAEAESLARQQGFELEIYTALSPQEQKHQLSEVMAGEVGALVLWPLDAEVTDLALPAAAENDTGLVLYQPVPQEGAVTFSGADQRIGELTARYLGRYFSDQPQNETVGILEIVDEKSAVSRLRTEGLRTGLKDNMNVVHQIETDGSGQDTRTKLKDYLNSAPSAQLGQIQAVVCQSDLICKNALTVLEQIDSVCRPQLVTGVGGDRELIEELTGYPCDVVTYSYSPKMLTDVVRLGIRVMNGEAVRQQYTEPIIEIDKGTVDAYVQSDNYHKRYGTQ